MIVNNIRIHLWFAINIALLGASFLKPNLFFGGLWFIFVISSFVLKSRKEINREFNSPVPIAGVLLMFVIVILLIISAITGFTEKSNIYFKNHPIIPSLTIAGLICLVIFAYIKMLSNKSNRKGTEK